MAKNERETGAKMLELAQKNEQMYKALHRIGYEPIGRAEAKDHEILNEITTIARDAIDDAGINASGKIASMPREEVYKRIEAASKELFRSERGARVRGQLLTLLEGPISQLDNDHWASIFTLIDFYRSGWTGAVLEELRES